MVGELHGTGRWQISEGGRVSRFRVSGCQVSDSGVGFQVRSGQSKNQ